MKKTVVFLSDFGYDSPYAGICKEVILNINSNINIVDLTHNIPPFNIIPAIFILRNSFTYFPPNSVFLCIVDPEVGSKRKGIIVKAYNRFFVGPDNGIFSFIEKTNIQKIISVENKSYFLPVTSSTFHGRDIFSPVCAFLSSGVPIENFGPQLKSIKRTKIPMPYFKNNTIYGEIIYIDHFGNLISNIEKEYIEDSFPDTNRLKVALISDTEDKMFEMELKKTYSDVKVGSYLALINSFNLLEVSINCGSATQHFGKGVGTKVIVKPLYTRF